MQVILMTLQATPPNPRSPRRRKALSMARYTGPKARINRRLGALIYETAGAARALDRRPAPPGMHTRGRRPSNYGLALM